MLVGVCYVLCIVFSVVVCCWLVGWLLLCVFVFKHCCLLFVGVFFVG